MWRNEIKRQLKHNSQYVTNPKEIVKIRYLLWCNTLTLIYILGIVYTLGNISP